MASPEELSSALHDSLRQRTGHDLEEWVALGEMARPGT